jgi:hypothetical protein
MAMATVMEAVPMPIEVGREMTDLRRFFPDVRWQGIIHAGGMGPGTPEMTATGYGAARMIHDGRWVAGDFEQDQFLVDGTFVLRWQLHWVCGWDPEHREYRASMVDNYGHAMVYRGRIDGDRLVFQSMPDADVRLRFTWDASDESAILWKNEVGLPDGSWFPVEEYRMVPVRAT